MYGMNFASTNLSLNIDSFLWFTFNKLKPAEGVCAQPLKGVLLWRLVISP